jgi:hypothetical protein
MMSSIFVTAGRATKLPALLSEFSTDTCTSDYPLWLRLRGCQLPYHVVVHTDIGPGLPAMGIR